MNTRSPFTASRSALSSAVALAIALVAPASTRAFTDHCTLYGAKNNECRPTLWPKGIVYYEWTGTNWTADGKKRVERAMSFWTEMTGGAVKFVYNKTDADRVKMNGDKCCKSPRGYRPGVTVNLGNATDQKAQHELGHLLGLPHHHKRSDRLRFMKVDENMVCKGPHVAADAGDTKKTMESLRGTCSLPMTTAADRAAAARTVAARAEGTDCFEYDTTIEEWVSDSVSTCTDMDYGLYDLDSVMHYQCGSGLCFIQDKKGQPLKRGFRGTACREVEVEGVKHQNCIMPSDASALVEMYAEENGWTRFRPVYRADPGPTTPLDMQLVSGVSMAGSPALALEGGTKVTVIARGDDDRYYLKAQKSDGTWPLGSFQELPGRWIGGPAVVSWSAGNLDVVGLGEDGRVWHAAKRNSAAWVVTGSLGRPETSIGSPTVASWGVDHLAVFVIGSSKLLYVKTWNGKAWGSWTPIAFGFKARPAAVAWGRGRIDVFAVGDAANDVQTVVYDEAACARGARCIDGWLDPLPFGGVAPSSIGGEVKAGTSPAVASRGVDYLNVYVVGKSGRLFLRSWNGTKWGTWSDLGGMPEGSPGAVTTPQGTAHVAANLGGVGLFHRQW